MSDNKKTPTAKLMIHSQKPASAHEKTESQKKLEERLNAIFNENTAAKITREVYAQADKDFFLSPAQARDLGLLDAPAPRAKENKGPQG